MPQSLARHIAHIVFSTKNRQPFIDDAIEERLWSYLGGICNSLDCPPVRIGGYRDHVHILCAHSKNIALKDLLEEVKKSSSKWMKTVHPRFSDFHWQNGYASFSADARFLDGVENYIINQKAHHEWQSFQDECRKLFKEFGVNYDERYGGIERARLRA